MAKLYTLSVYAFLAARFAVRLAIGPVVSVAGKLTPRDAGQVLVTVLTFLGAVFSASSMVLGDVSHAFAWIAAAIVAVIATLNKWFSGPTAKV